MGEVGQKPSNVRRIVFKEIPPGDFKKFVAESNISASGGGARDLRFRPHEHFGPVFARMFPGREVVRRRRGGFITDIEVFVGTLAWESHDGTEQHELIRYESPTDARGGEGRIARVHEYPPFNNQELSVAGGRVVLLLIERDNGVVWAEFTTEHSLRTEPWAASVRDPILECFAQPRRTGVVARGYIDFESEEAYCGG